jgi:ADP-heptose:LPS heptosyltransferase
MSGLSYSADTVEIEAKDTARLRHGLDRRPYVTVHNGYDPNMVVSHARATKCYPHFDQAIAILRASHPDVTFVQIGIHTSQPMEAADLSLIGKTTLPEAAGLIRGALFHIDNEGGLVHLAAAMGRQSCVVFGPTSSRYFGYPSNINVDPNFCGGCWWINETWMNHCPRGFATARCMTEQPASIVARAAEALFPIHRIVAPQRRDATQTVG